MVEFGLQASSLMSVNSVTSVTRPAHIKPSSSSINRRAIEGVGDAFQLPCGRTEITFSDGSRLAIPKPDQGGSSCGGGFYFTDSNGVQYFYPTGESIPPAVRERLQQVQGAVAAKCL